MNSLETADTRDRLLTAAAALMWERSFQAAGVDELCQKANARKGSFYYFFKSKSDLAVAAIERSWVLTKTMFFEPIFSGSRSESGLKRIQKLIENISEFQSQVASGKSGILGCPFGNLGQEMARQDEKIRASLQQIFVAHCDYIESALDSAVQAGEIPPGDNRQRAENIFALLEGALLLAKVANDIKIFRRTASTVMAVAAA